MTHRLVKVPVLLIALMPLVFVACKKGDEQSPAAADTSANSEPPVATDTKDSPGLEEAVANVKNGQTIEAIGADGTTKTVTIGSSTVADTEWYTIELELPDATSANQEGKTVLHVHPKSGWKINQDYPTKLSVKAPPEVQMVKTQLKRADAQEFSEKAVVFSMGFTASSAGDKEFEADFNFAVCEESTCIPKKETLAWAVPVK